MRARDRWGGMWQQKLALIAASALGATGLFVYTKSGQKQGLGLLEEVPGDAGDEQTIALELMCDHEIIKKINHAIMTMLKNEFSYDSAVNKPKANFILYPLLSEYKTKLNSVDALIKRQNISAGDYMMQILRICTIPINEARASDADKSFIVILMECIQKCLQTTLSEEVKREYRSDNTLTVDALLDDLLSSEYAMPNDDTIKHKLARAAV